ncbi:MAG TPA: phosphotransferase [Candidatus Binatia bacterium]|nr:phosphotransferase [Candidatus Binatia bacterium]
MNEAGCQEDYWRPDMIEGLDDLLEDSGQPGLVELRLLLQEIFNEPAALGQVLEQRKLPSRRLRVYRLRFVFDGWVRSVVAKRMELDNAQRNQLAIRRWLPAVGLGDNGPTLLGVAVARNGECAWHVYDDLGDRALDTAHLDPQHVRTAVELIAQVHMRFAGHALLAECRLLGSDFGIDFYAANLRDAIRCLEALQPPAVHLSAKHAALRDRLLARLRQLQAEQPRRAQALAELGGPETLLHGDLWASHVFVLPAVHGVQARLVGWDHAGVGPVSYDLSAFLLRFPFRYRLWILDLYRKAVNPAGWNLPSPGHLNVSFETAEFARFANCIIWPAIALVHDRFGWGFDELSSVDQWFESWEPVLPEV